MIARYMERFVEIGDKAFHIIRNNQLDLKLYPVLFAIFGKCFYDVVGNLNSMDILAEVMIDQSENLSREALFVSEIFEDPEDNYDFASKQIIFGNFQLV